LSSAWTGDGDGDSVITIEEFRLMADLL